MEIGQLSAVLMGTKMLAPNIWGWLADRSGQRVRIIRLGALIAVALFAGIFLQPGFWGMALVLGGFSFFWNAIMPQFEVVTLRYLKRDTEQYSRIRLWGSVGFVLAVIGLGWLFERASLDRLPWVLMGLLIMIAISSFTVRGTEVTKSAKGSLSSFFRQLLTPQVILFFGICFLLQISHGPYYTFFSIFLEEHGYSKTLIGWLWALGVLAEIGIFLIAHKLFAWFSVRTMVVSCLVVAVVRWCVIGAFADSIWLIVLAQLAHAATFGVFHAIAIYLIHRYFNSEASGQGQGMYSAFSFGAGGALGAWLSGLIVETQGGSVAYFMAAAAAGLAALLALKLREPATHSAQQRYSGRARSRSGSSVQTVEGH